MNPERQRLQALAAVIATARSAVAMACRTLQESAAALLRNGAATLAEVSAPGNVPAEQVQQRHGSAGIPGPS